MEVINLNESNRITIYDEKTQELHIYYQDITKPILSIKLNDINKVKKMWINNQLQRYSKQNVEKYILWIMDHELDTHTLRICCIDEEGKRKNILLDGEKDPFSVYFDGTYMCLQVEKMQGHAPLDVLEECPNWIDYATLSIHFHFEREHDPNSLISVMRVESTNTQFYSPRIHVVKINGHYYHLAIFQNIKDRETLSLNITKITQSGNMATNYVDIPYIALNSDLIQATYLEDTEQLICLFHEPLRKQKIGMYNSHSVKALSLYFRQRKEIKYVSNKYSDELNRPGLDNIKMLEKGVIHPWCLYTLGKPSHTDKNTKETIKTKTVAKHDCLVLYDRESIWVWHKHGLSQVDRYGVYKFAMYHLDSKNTETSLDKLTFEHKEFNYNVTITPDIQSVHITKSISDNQLKIFALYRQHKKIAVCQMTLDPQKITMLMLLTEKPDTTYFLRDNYTGVSLFKKMENVNSEPILLECFE